MHLYTLHQWLLLFYLYCFIGWIWESCYVSLEKHKWINRGFLKGPLLPIYGSGAIVVLFSTLGVEENIILIFIIGMIVATILEYITGATMEKMFHVRYWDYSQKLFNINGHICLLSSLTWGVFSILLVKFINPPIASLIISIPDQISEISAYIITIFITIDGVQSFNEAMDLKNILIKITERNEIIAHIKKRIEVVEAFVSEDIRVMQEKLIERSAIKQEESLVKKQTRRQFIEAVIRKNLDLKAEKIKALSDKVSKYIEKFDEPSKFSGYLARLKIHEKCISNTESNIYINSINILRRNPNAKSKKYEEAMKEVKDLDKELNNK